MKILLIDDHDMFRDGICMLLNKEHPNTKILQAKTHQQALEQLKVHNDLTLVLLDLYLQDSSPHENIQHIRNLYPDIPITIISGEERPEFIGTILEYGVNGYIPKTIGNDEFINALKQVLNGQIYLPENIATDLKRRQDDSSQSFVSLTLRQKQVLVLMAQGLHNHQIAEKLNIAENTVNVHVKNIFKILNVNNRTEAGLIASKYELI